MRQISYEELVLDDHGHLVAQQRLPGENQVYEIVIFNQIIIS